jgi:hypothetical protein
VGHVAALELPTQESRALSRGTHGSAGAHLSKEERSGAKGHVAAPEFTLVRRRGPGPRDMWQRQSSPQHGGEVQGRGIHGGAGAHLCGEMWSEATAYVATRG